MDIRNRFSIIQPARLAHIVGIAAVAGGLLYWGLCWWQIPSATPAGRVLQTSVVDPTASTVAKWLGPGDVHLNVVVQGVMIRRQRAVALLSINDARPEPFIAGETIMENVKIRSIDADGVVLERGGKPLHISSPISPQWPKNGIVREAQTR